MNKITYKTTDREDTLYNVYDVSMGDKYLIISYFDGDFHHTRNIPLIILVSFVIS